VRDPMHSSARTHLVRHFGTAAQSSDIHLVPVSSGWGIMKVLVSYGNSWG
jgi:hypothetical protein